MSAQKNESILTDDDCLPPSALLANDQMYPTTQALISDQPNRVNNIRPLTSEGHHVTEVTEPRHSSRQAPHQQRYLKESSGYSSSSTSTVQLAPTASTMGSRPMTFVRSLNDGLEPTKRTSNRRENVRFASADTLHEEEYKISV